MAERITAAERREMAERMTDEERRRIRIELDDMQRRLGHLTPADTARLRELLNATRPRRLDAAVVPLRPRLPSDAAPAAPCNIDFTRTRIPELINVEDDLSDEIEPFTQESFMPGQEYYRVTIEGNRPYYFSIDGLQQWLRTNQCRHPILQNVFIAQRDIERFTYTGPPIMVVGGRKFKKISKRLRQKSKRIKKSIRRLRY